MVAKLSLHERNNSHAHSFTYYLQMLLYYLGRVVYLWQRPHLFLYWKSCCPLIYMTQPTLLDFNFWVWEPKPHITLLSQTFMIPSSLTWFNDIIESCYLRTPQVLAQRGWINGDSLLQCILIYCIYRTLWGIIFPTHFCIPMSSSYPVNIF